MVREADRCLREARRDDRAPLRAEIDPDDTPEIAVAHQERAAVARQRERTRRDDPGLRLLLLDRSSSAAGAAAHSQHRCEHEQDDGELAHRPQIHRRLSSGYIERELDLAVDG
jgi:hypothetical protein